ncbi:MAG: arsenate reductase (thioredoxin) [Eubacteriales bacterium]
MAGKNILFLCTGNSCRSQMAEGYAKKYGRDLKVNSAGIEAHGLNPRAVAAMNEVGIDISHQPSDIVTPEMLKTADLVITLCGHAKDSCPVIPPGCEHRHWGLDDPARASGTEEEITEKFREVRGEIELLVKKLLHELQEGIDI